MSEVILKQNDTGIGLKANLTNKDGAVNLTNADVLFLFRKFKITASVADAENGIVKVYFNKEHTGNIGTYNAEFEVKFNDGRVETYPNDSYLKVRIISDLGGRS